MQDQQRFAAATGDFNPIHLDPVAARRTQAGAPIVHGMHGVLWALERLAEQGRLASTIRGLTITFRRFLYVGTSVDLNVLSEAPDRLTIELSSDDLPATHCEVALGEQGALDAPLPDVPAASWPQDPARLELTDLEGQSGCLPVPSDGAAALFPHLAERLGAQRVDGMAALSTLVGMVCPGLYSIFGACRLDLLAASRSFDLKYAVRAVDERFRSIETAVEGPGFSGTVTAYVTQPPAATARYSRAAALVARNEFAHVHALVIGGTRGLGAAVAAAVVAGGGRAIITYALGEEDGRAVVADLGSARAGLVHYDIFSDAQRQLDGLPPDVNQLYYFASPRIYRPKAAPFVRERLEEFLDYYVMGFAEVVDAARTRCRPLSVFYPSSVFVDERPSNMIEYAMAKAAGEVLCTDIGRRRDVRIVVRRFPRTNTDQMAGNREESADPLDVVIPVVRDMSA